MDYIAPKPTVYAGRHFRSKLEASWAVWFDAMSWPWTYEPTPLVDDYAPDFLLEGAIGRSPIYVECKPERYRQWIDRHETDIERWRVHVRAAFPVPLLLIIGRPGIWHEGQLDRSSLNVATILFWIGDLVDVAGRPPPATAYEGDMRSTAVWFTGCDRCGEVGLAWIGEHLECVCLRERWKTLPRRIIQAAEAVRNMDWRNGANH